MVRDEGLEELFKSALKSAKEHAVKSGDQEYAKAIWGLETILDIQGNYLSAYQRMKQKKFYDAWIILERIEIELRNFNENGFRPDDDMYKLKFIEKHIKQFQSLFPYKYFLSPGYFVIEKKCSICNKVISIRNLCGQEKGIFTTAKCVFM